jgi:hypothetical protein
MQQQRQYLYFCTSKASKWSTFRCSSAPLTRIRDASSVTLLRQYLYFCKASKVSTSKASLRTSMQSAAHANPRRLICREIASEGYCREGRGYYIICRGKEGGRCVCVRRGGNIRDSGTPPLVFSRETSLFLLLLLAEETF